jgi:glutamine amidotransferase
MIVIIDIGIGNIKSIENMLNKIGAEVVISSKPDIVSSASAIIFPGVGSFDHGMNKLNESGLLPILVNKVLEGNVPFLGICLGMQLLFDRSEEGVLPGLGWLSGTVKKFNFSNVKLNKALKVPHMGWNIVNPTNYDDLYGNLQQEARFYFVHSFHVNCRDESDIHAKSNHGYSFTCSVHRNNIWGVQFHPEKSHRFGFEFFKNFLMVVKSA